MRRSQVVLLSVTLFVLAVSTAYAKPEVKPKPWLSDKENSEIGFGLIELLPKEGGSTFDFQYHLKPPASARAISAQIVIIPASLAAEYDEIPLAEILTRSISNRDHDGNILVEATVTISKPELMIVAYGPYQGIISSTGSITSDYRLSVNASGEAQYTWIDQDAGEITLFDYSSTPGLEDLKAAAIIWLIRDKIKLLRTKESFSFQRFVLHPAALERVEAFEANW